MNQAAHTSIPLTATQYNQDVSTMLFPELAAAGVESTSSPLLGVLPRPAPELVAGAKATPYTFAEPNNIQAATASTAMPLDSATSGVPTPNDLALERAYDNALAGSLGIPQPNQGLPNAASLIPRLQNAASLLPGLQNAAAPKAQLGFQAAYQNTPAYQNELRAALLNQMQSNMGSDVARNYENGLYLQSIYNSLKGTLSPAQLQAYMAREIAFLNSQYAKGQLPIAASLAYDPGAYANLPIYEQQLNAMNLKKKEQVAKPREAFA